MAQARRPLSEKTSAELASDLSRQVATMVHLELELARSEMTRKAKRMGLGGGVLGVATVAAGLAAACLTVCVIAALHLVLSLWLSALITAAIYLVGAATLALIARVELVRAGPPLPETAVESTKENIAWIKKRAKSDGS